MHRALCGTGLRQDPHAQLRVLQGEVVAICNMKALAADGVSFAIPIDAAKEVVAALAAHGRVIRPYIGIKMLQRGPLAIPWRAT